MNELVKIVNVNYEFYEYLHLQTDTNKLDIPEILLRKQQIELFFLVEYLNCLLLYPYFSSHLPTTEKGKI